MILPAVLARFSPPGPADFARYLRTETFGGVVLLVAAAVALVWANSPWSHAYVDLRDTHVGTSFLDLDLTVGHWAQEAVLAVFFFVAGLELKREVAVGELSSVRQAILPVVAALGGVIVPIGVFLTIAHGTPGAGRAWAIPAATDIAFALGVLALAGSRIPSSARVFLLALAVVDDLVAIVIIAVLFTATIDWRALGIAVAACAVYALAQHLRVRSTLLYAPLAVVTWVAVYQSGVHATIAGVALGLLTRVRTDSGEPCSPGDRLEHRLQPVSAAVCVPLFALSAAGVPLRASVFGDLATDRIAIGVAVALIVGKTVGIFGVSFLAIRSRLVPRPEGLSLRDMLAVALLGGIGFTVSLLIADLALPLAEAQTVKAVVLLTSLVASVLAATALIRRGRAHAARSPRRNASGSAAPVSTAPG